MRRPTRDDRCSCGTRTVCWTSQGQRGSGSCAQGSAAAAHDPAGRAAGGRVLVT